MDHPLDRPIWHALASHYAPMALGDVRARRFPPQVHFFAAAADDGADAQAALAALAGPEAPIALIEATPPPLPMPPGIGITRQVPIEQMLLAGDVAPGPVIDAVALGDHDAADMRALAELTRPGPFFAATHRMGGFVGVRRGGALIAMAGERLRLPGFTEVSAVCTHPDHRGQGLAPALMRIVIAHARARGDAVFLHAYPDNPAIGLYEAMGFAHRRTLTLTVIERTAPACAPPPGR